jgi:hypothetical protein
VGNQGSRQSEDRPDEASLDGIIDRLKRQKAPRAAVVMLHHLQREGVPQPATDLREFLQISERHFARLENLLLDESAVVVYLDRVDGKRTKMYALREWAPVLARLAS